MWRRDMKIHSKSSRNTSKLHIKMIKSLIFFFSYHYSFISKITLVRYSIKYTKLENRRVIRYNSFTIS